MPAMHNQFTVRVNKMGEFMPVADIKPVAAAKNRITTKRGHVYDVTVKNRNNDNYCIHCGSSGHFDYIIDYRPCIWGHK